MLLSFLLLCLLGTESHLNSESIDSVASPAPLPSDFVIYVARIPAAPCASMASDISHDPGILLTR